MHGRPKSSLVKYFLYKKSVITVKRALDFNLFCNILLSRTVFSNSINALVHIVWPHDPFSDISATDPGSSNDRRKLNYPCVVAIFANALNGKYGLSTYSNKIITIITFIRAAKA